MGRYNGAGRVPPRSSGSRPGLECPSSSGPQGWKSPGADCGARTSRAGQGRRGASGQSSAKKSAQVRTRLTLQIWADLPRQRTPELWAAASLPPLTGSALAACSAPHRSLRHRRCHPSRPPPPELQAEPSRAEPYRAPPRQRPSASEPGPASRGWGQQNPAPGPASGKGGACGVLPGGSPRGWAARANGRWRRGGTLLSVDRCGWRRTMKATRSRGAGRLGSRMEGEARVPGLTATEHEASGGRGRGLEESGMGWDVLGWRSPGPGVIVPASCSSPLLGLRAQSCSGEL